MTVYLVGAGPGDPGLLTVRGAELLRRADVVVYDRLVQPSLLALAPPGARLVDVGKQPGRPHRQRDIDALLVHEGLEGATVVRLKGGDPFLFGRGGEEAQALLSAGVDFEVVPGVSSAIAAPAAAGVPVTQRGLSSSVTIVTGHVGDPSAPGAVDWESLARAGGTLVVLMGMADRAEIARRLLSGGRAPSTPVLVVHWGTTPMQHSVRTRLDSLGEIELAPPATIVIGPVAALELSNLEKKPLHGVSVVVTRAPGRAGPLVAKLATAGASVVELPVIAIADPLEGGLALAHAARRASTGAYDWIAFTSAEAVERFVVLIRDGRDLAGVSLAVVGEATGHALEARGLVPDLVSPRASAADLAATFPDATEGARPVLFARSEQARDVLAPALRSKGWVVDEVVAYRTRAAGPQDGATEEAVASASACEVVTFTSPSTVEQYLKLTQGRQIPPVVVCIGPVTAREARSRGLSVDVVAESQSASGLVEALVDYHSRIPGRAQGGAPGARTESP